MGRLLTNTDTASLRLAVILIGLAISSGCREGKRAEGVLSAQVSKGPVDFNRDIRPILNQRCVVCHGGVKMSGSLSFVFREDATRKGESGKMAIVPGDAGHSELIARLVTKDPEKRMPPVDHGHGLEPAQIDLFRHWINEGAHWSEHWAFVAPKPQIVPELRGDDLKYVRNPIDHFIVDRLRRQGLSPSPEADKTELLRRLSFDLTGLPPTPKEVDAFLADAEPGAYERQVERLLASPQFGERWASVWLDLARYADTSGLYADTPREMWQYRDWVINALNRNMPYDEFVVEQIAGDLLPNPTMDQLIATAFHRNSLSNDEPGTDNEENRIAAVQDRAATTWAALNGVSFNCVQCHSHPYDPIRNKEYYGFLGFFNTTADADYDLNDFPTLRVPDDPARKDELLRLQRESAALRREVLLKGRALWKEPKMWGSAPIVSASGQASSEAPNPGEHVTFDLKDGEAFAVGPVHSTATYDLIAQVSPGTLTAYQVEVPPLNPEKARHTPEPGFIVTRIEAWKVRPDGSEEPIKTGSFWADSTNSPQRKLELLKSEVIKKRRAATPPVPPAEGGLQQGAAKPDPLLVADEKKKTYGTPAGPDPALPEGGFAANSHLFQTRWIVGAFDQPVSFAPGERLKIRLSHNEGIGGKPAVVRRVHLTVATDDRWSHLAQDVDLPGKRHEIEALDDKIAAIPGSQLPVMQELPPEETRAMAVFHRGNFMDKTGEPLEPDVPAIFPRLPAGMVHDRLALARWLVSPEQPLTARIAVNRFWEQLFGLGLVETLEDFGSVGQLPSHPELLDWLALRFENDLKWDVKALVKELVLSATYRQQGVTTAKLLALDPRNRLLARGPRNRLSAEMVRDSALLSAGLLSPKMYGPAVMPLQPEGVWPRNYLQSVWINSEGEDRFRRALYTYWRRTSAYPSLLTFDMPVRDVCAVRRIPTNNPLQALVTLNDPVYIEAAKGVARRMQVEGGGTLDDQIVFGFRLGTTRRPTATELAALTTLYHESEKLSGPGDTLGAMTAVASAILNLDDALTK